MPVTITICVYKNNELINERSFSQGTIKIGRLASTDLQVDDPTVSRVHAVIELQEDGACEVVDVGSTAGVFLAGVKISRSPLHSGDELTLGKTRLKIQIDTKSARPEIDAAMISGKGVDFDLFDEEIFSNPRLSATKPFASVFDKPYEPDSNVSFNNRMLEITVTMRGEPLGVHKFSQRVQRVLLGSTRRCQLNYSPDGLPTDEFPVIKKSGTDYSVVFPEGLPGEAEIGGAKKTLAELQHEKRALPDPELSGCFQYNILAESRVHLEFPYYDLWIRFVSKPPVIPTGLFQQFDYNMLNSMLSSLVIVATFIAGLMLYPFAIKERAEDIQKQTNKFVQLLITPAEKSPEDELLKKKLEKEKSGESGAKAARKEGKMGKQDAPEKKDMRSAVKAIKPQDKEIVMKQGLLGLLSNSGVQGMGAMNPFGGTGLGGDLRNALGGVVGRQIGDSYGIGGLGLRGMGPGGGGDSFNSIGLGSVGTRGRGAGEGGYGAGYGLGTKKDKDIVIGSDAPVVYGSLDKELIRRVIQAHRNEIKYCYQRQLQVNEMLRGKINVHFTIGADGRVIQAKIKETTMNNAEVENCMVAKVKTWKFPEPKGGGIVIVTYPFIFAPQG